MTGAPTYDWWMSALELTEYVPLTREQLYTLGVHDEPQPGFYRIPPSYFVVVDGVRRKRRESDGMEDRWVAIWPTDSGLAASVDGQPADPAEIWMACCEAPINETRYRKMERAGFTSGLTLGLTA